MKAKKRYLVLVNGREHGPYSGREVKQLAREKSLLPDDLVWSVDNPKRYPARRFAGLFPASEAQAAATATRRQTAPPPANPAERPTRPVDPLPPPGRLRRVFDEARQVVRATHRRTMRFCRHAAFRTGPRSTQHAFDQARVQLGTMLANHHLGDEELRRQIESLDGRIHELEAANASTLDAEHERIGALVRLADSWIN